MVEHQPHYFVSHSGNSKKDKQWENSFFEKVDQKSENCWISEMSTIQPKIPGEKSNGTEIPEYNFSKLCVYLARLPFFALNSRKCCSICCLRLLEIQIEIFGRMGSALNYPKHWTSESWCLSHLGLHLILTIFL